MRLTCTNCRSSFVQRTGRPAMWCPSCRQDGGRYDGEHKKIRAQGLEAAYGAPCARCGVLMLRGQDLELDHADGGGPRDYLGFSHRDCNRRAGASLGGQIRAARHGPYRGASRRSPTPRVPIGWCKSPAGCTSHDHTHERAQS
jgi:hypothetical protein